MPRGRKKLTLDEKIRETQQSIYNLENRTQELYEELQGLLEEKKRQELEKLSGVKIPKAIEEIRTAPVRHNTVAEAADMPQVVKKILKIQ